MLHHMFYYFACLLSSWFCYHCFLDLTWYLGVCCCLYKLSGCVCFVHWLRELRRSDIITRRRVSVLWRYPQTTALPGHSYHKYLTTCVRIRIYTHLRED